MKLDQTKINDIDRALGLEETRLELEWRTAATHEKPRIEPRLIEVRDRRTALARIVSRNMAQLHHVQRKVFVSHHFEGGTLPAWLDAVFDKINVDRADGKFKPVIGKAEQMGDFLLAILQKMIGCHFFLSVVTADTPEDGWPIHPFLLEELGAAFPLPIPVIIAVEEGSPIRKEKIGKMMGDRWQRMTFVRDRKAEFARDLAAALDEAYEAQKADIEAAHRALARLFN